MSLTSYRAAPPRVGGVCARLARCWLRAVLACVRCWLACRASVALGTGCAGSGLPGRPGGDLLSRVLRRSTIGAEGFHGRVRDGIGCLTPRHDHQVVEEARVLPGGCCRGLVCVTKGRVAAGVAGAPSRGPASRRSCISQVLGTWGLLPLRAGSDQAERAISKA